jgi:hypothetical protein
LPVAAFPHFNALLLPGLLPGLLPPFLSPLQVVRCDPCSGASRDDVFTSFLFASRRKAFELMVARWRAVK